jgi:hypothetical protein
VKIDAEHVLRYLQSIKRHIATLTHAAQFEIDLQRAENAKKFSEKVKTDGK